MTGEPMASVEPLNRAAGTGAAMSKRGQALLDKVRQAADFAPDLDRAYVVKGWLGAGTLSVMFGAPNTGKTFLALDMAVHIAGRGGWRGCRVVNGPVLYIASEGSNSMGNRIAAIEE